MEKITLLDTCIGSTNRGDDIIMQCAEEELGWLMQKYYPLRAPTHLRSFGVDECIGALPDSAGEIAASKYKFVCGTNLLKTNMLHRTNQWDINLWNCKPIKGCILLGVGGGGKIENRYTKTLYKKVLSNKYIHSVRTKEAYELVTSLGLSCINTGCVTLWKLTPEFCRNIPEKKADNAVFTLTDYCRDAKRDGAMIDILRCNYKKLYFWVQGTHDLEYLEELTDTKEIVIIPPLVSAYSSILQQPVDYVGTRLHAGIFAMRHTVRSVIVTIDQRMDAMSSCIPENCLPRKQLAELEKKICNPIKTTVNLDWTAIDLWKGQFK